MCDDVTAPEEYELFFCSTDNSILQMKEEGSYN